MAKSINWESTEGVEHCNTLTSTDIQAAIPDKQNKPTNSKSILDFFKENAALNICQTGNI